MNDALAVLGLAIGWAFLTVTLTGEYARRRFGVDVPSPAPRARPGDAVPGIAQAIGIAVILAPVDVVMLLIAHDSRSQPLSRIAALALLVFNVVWFAYLYVRVRAARSPVPPAP